MSEWNNFLTGQPQNCNKECAYSVQITNHAVFHNPLRTRVLVHFSRKAQRGRTVVMASSYSILFWSLIICLAIILRCNTLSTGSRIVRGCFQVCDSNNYKNKLSCFTSLSRTFLQLLSQPLQVAPRQEGFLCFTGPECSSKCPQNNYFYAAEHYSRGHRLWSHLIVSQHFMEPEGSSSNSQELSTCPYPWSDQCSSRHPILSLQLLKLHGLSTRANYTDRATAACRRSDCQLLRIEGATWSTWRIPQSVFSIF
jgi:hypothetical protein